MHETTTKRPVRAGKYIRRALLALAAVLSALFGDREEEYQCMISR